VKVECGVAMGKEGERGRGGDKEQKMKVARRRGRKVVWPEVEIAIGEKVR
jgi:hypothetical protein